MGRAARNLGTQKPHPSRDSTSHASGFPTPAPFPAAPTPRLASRTQSPIPLYPSSPAGHARDHGDTGRATPDRGAACRFQPKSNRTRNQGEHQCSRISPTRTSIRRGHGGAFRGGAPTRRRRARGRWRAGVRAGGGPRRREAARGAATAEAGGGSRGARSWCRAWGIGLAPSFSSWAASFRGREVERKRRGAGLKKCGGGKKIGVK